MHKISLYFKATCTSFLSTHTFCLQCEQSSCTEGKGGSGESETGIAACIESFKFSLLFIFCYQNYNVNAYNLGND